MTWYTRIPRIGPQKGLGLKGGVGSEIADLTCLLSDDSDASDEMMNRMRVGMISLSVRGVLDTTVFHTWTAA